MIKLLPQNIKPERNHLYIAMTSIALLAVLVIQVDWIFSAARLKEESFNEKATMVLSKTADVLSSDTVTVKRMEVCMGMGERRKIDSLLNYYMKLYNFHLDYYFEVKAAPPIQNKSLLMYTPDNSQPGCYQTCLADVRCKDNSNSNGAVQLKLVFPDKEEFLMAEMGIPFITSVLLILVVIFMSWRTILSLMKEKRISEHTTDFLNNMTHEFKTPLTNIALAGKMMIKDHNVKQEEKIKHYSAIILEENEKLRQQVEHVLSMTALERGEIPLQKTELDFHELILGALKCITVQLENLQGNLKLNLEAHRFIMMGDRTHLASALCNLVDNAIKYSTEKPDILIRTYAAAGNLIIVITDNGIGIEEKYHQKVFEKFFRVPTGNAHNVKGFGLGLAYIKKIIEMHGGTIKLESEPGKGTTFMITLPHV